MPGERGGLDVEPVSGGGPVTHDLTQYPIHLGTGATATAEPCFTGAMEWYADYAVRHAADGAEGRLVTLFGFSESWTSWEMHPHGDEVVVCLRGAMTLHQEAPDGTIKTITLAENGYAINAPGVWHTADVSGDTTALFITAGLGTQVRAR